MCMHAGAAGAVPGYWSLVTGHWSPSEQGEQHQLAVRPAFWSASSSESCSKNRSQAAFSASKLCSRLAATRFLSNRQRSSTASASGVRLGRSGTSSRPCAPTRSWIAFETCQLARSQTIRIGPEISARIVSGKASAGLACSRSCPSDELRGSPPHFRHPMLRRGTTSPSDRERRPGVAPQPASRPAAAGKAPKLGLILEQHGRFRTGLLDPLLDLPETLFPTGRLRQLATTTKPSGLASRHARRPRGSSLQGSDVSGR